MRIHYFLFLVGSLFLCFGVNAIAMADDTNVPNKFVPISLEEAKKIYKHRHNKRTTKEINLTEAAFSKTSERVVKAVQDYRTAFFVVLEMREQQKKKNSQQQR